MLLSRKRRKTTLRKSLMMNWIMTSTSISHHVTKQIKRGKTEKWYDAHALVMVSFIMRALTFKLKRYISATLFDQTIRKTLNTRVLLEVVD